MKATLKDQAAATIQKLLKLTRAGKIEWERFRDTSTVTKGTSNEVDVLYEAEHDGMKFRVYEVRYLASPDGDTYEWTSRPCIELLDDLGYVLFDFPYTPDTYDLISTVQIKANNVEGLLSRFLKSDD